MRYVRELSDQEQGDVQKALKEWRDPSEVRRVRALRLFHKGWTAPQIAEVLDCTRRSVRHWIDLYEAEGLKGLRTRPRSDRPPKVDEHYRRMLKETLETVPRGLGLPLTAARCPAGHLRGQKRPTSRSVMGT